MNTTCSLAKLGNKNNEIYIDRLDKYNILLVEMRHEENSSGQLVSSNLNDCKMSNNSVTS
jgi:hypothetical protein